MLVQNGAKVTDLAVRDDLAPILGCAQELADDFVESKPLRAGQVNGTVRRRSQGDIDQGVNHVVRQDGLEKGRRGANRLPLVGELRADRPDELEEPRGAEDAIGYVCVLDRLLLGDLRTHVAAIGDAVGADNG